ncbi:MAG: GIY-YIG nuclease family protein [Elusimicrobia bacterium]|nr:GIY-YIG nuclease family protein [Elusimicrobiota bacterium]
MVQCVDGTYYTGSTNNLEARVKLHNAGNGAKYLRGKGPVQLVYAKEFRYYKNALHAERSLKKATRQQKEELVRIYGRNLPSANAMDAPAVLLPQN